MTPVEFICHSKQLDQLCRASEGSIRSVPVAFPKMCKELLKRRGFGGIIGALAGNRAAADLTAIVNRNLLRRQIRLPQIYTIPVVKSLYGLFMLLRARLQAALVTSYFEEHPDARALVFNGYLMPDSITKVVGEALGRRALVLENGFFPGTSQADSAGINFDSTLPRDPSFYAWVSRQISGERPRELVSRPSKQKAAELVQTSPRYIFVPMQVPSDMQILKHSPWIADMKHFYEVIYRLAERQPEWRFVVKEHPSFPLSIQPHVRPHSRILFANHNETKKLIKDADAVLTVNSTVGLEGLVLGKKVITLGNAPYNVNGMVLQARNDEDLHTAMAKLAIWSPDLSLIDTFIRYVHNIFLVPGDVRKGDAAVLSALSARANGLDEHGRLTADFEEWSRAQNSS
jgi:capsular polysaccharide export protein